MSVLSLFCFVGNGWKWCIMKRTCAGRGVYDCGWPADFAVHLASFSAWRVDIGRDHVPQPQQDLPHCQSNNLNSSTPSFPSFPSFPHFSIFQPNTQQTQSRINPARRGTSWYVVSHRVTPSRPFLPIYKFFQKVTADQLRNVTRIRKIPDNKFIDEADWGPSEIKPTQPKTKMEKATRKTLNMYAKQVFLQIFPWKMKQSNGTSLEYGSSPIFITSWSQHEEWYSRSMWKQWSQVSQVSIFTVSIA